MLLRPTQFARRRVCALSRRSGRPGQPRPQTGRWLSTGTPPPPPPPQPPLSRYKRFWDWTLQPRPHWRESRTEAAVIFCVFGVTGSTSVAFVRPALKHTIGLEGSMRDGPWSYRVLSVVLVSPIYATFLVTFGTLAGRHIFFASMARKIFGRFLPSQYRGYAACPPARAKAGPP